MVYLLDGRRAELVVNNGQETRTYTDLDIEFKIVKTGNATPNESEISLINLGEDSRNFIREKNQVIELKAGYDDSIGRIFKGNLETVNHKQDHTEWLSEMYGKDGGAAIRDLTIFKTFAKDTPEKTVIEAVLKRLTDIPDGLKKEFQEINRLALKTIDLQSYKPKPPKPKDAKKVKKQPDTRTDEQKKKDYLDKRENNREKAEDRKLKRAETFRGEAVDKLEALCRNAGLVFVLNDMSLSIYPQGLAESDEIVLLDRYSGLIGSPERTQEGGFKVLSLLRHEFNPGLLVGIESRYMNGLFIINRLEHRGQRHANDWYSELYCTEYTG
jgi:hypothetical protein